MSFNDATLLDSIHHPSEQIQSYIDSISVRLFQVFANSKSPKSEVDVNASENVSRNVNAFDIVALDQKDGSRLDASAASVGQSLMQAINTGKILTRQRVQ
jgi:hypothetical protein